LQENSHIVVLGAGPAGLGAASQLVRRTNFQVTALEKNGWVGGNAASFELAGVNVDFGSHRLHPSCAPEILADIRAMLGDDLLDRPRHGRIRLRERWIHFPLQSLDLALHSPLGFSMGVGFDLAGKMIPVGTRPEDGEENFASVMERDLGKTICQDFYFPYARKLWGLEPEELSTIQAQRRVSNNSLSKMIRKVLASGASKKSKGGGRFFYPRLGFGQISQAYYQDALQGGANIWLEAEVKRIAIKGDNSIQVIYEQNGQTQVVDANHVWSTIPITALARSLQPEVPEQVLNAAKSIDYRAMLLIYLVLESDHFSEYDAHYFPESSIRISRLSESKNYSAAQVPIGRTVICAELPCSTGDPEWGYPDDALAEVVRDSLAKAGIPVKASISQILVRRLGHAYPIYRRGYELHFHELDAWIDKCPGLLSFGRQGLFAHDNTHHALYMAYSAVECFKEDGTFNRGKWGNFRRIFETHVVED
jgi:protoporphyrinogen oxidase